MKNIHSTLQSQKVSYAQNAEDIVLSRAFGDIQEGFYVDVGANDPTRDSVTKYFYDQGWHGINIEPSLQYQRELRTHRLRDINLFCLAGEQDGEADFYEIPDTGLSTARADLRLDHEERGHRGVSRRMVVRSLGSITSEFAPADIHFLKIDVEGFEMQVLKGVDWKSRRPWVVLVETTVPLEGDTEDALVVSFMERMNYRRCLFDGVNTYFVAQERADLARHFTSPANAHDRFLSSGFVNLLRERNEIFRSVREDAQKQADKLAAARSRLADMEGSLCWKLTAPVRVLDGLLRHRSVTLKALRDSFGRGERAAGAAPRTRPPQVAEFPNFMGTQNPEDKTSADWSGLRYPLQPEKTDARLTSCLCTKAQLESPAFRFWLERIEAPLRTHRKLWEFAYIIQALFERECLARGKRGLGFAVGEEALPALFASMGCLITATDLNPDDERAKPWAETSQLASSKEKLRKPGTCPDPLFDRSVTYRHVDMNHIPHDLAGFDFSWSSCSFEHCGSIELGLAFVENQMKCLKPGGIAVHTTEFNLTSDDETITEGTFVIFRMRDIGELVRRLEEQGHQVEKICYSSGTADEDKHIDIFPYSDAPHLKLLLGDRFVSTSIGLIIRKADD